MASRVRASQHQAHPWANDAPAVTCQPEGVTPGNRSFLRWVISIAELLRHDTLFHCLRHEDSRDGPIELARNGYIRIAALIAHSFDEGTSASTKAVGLRPVIHATNATHDNRPLPDACLSRRTSGQRPVPRYSRRSSVTERSNESSEAIVRRLAMRAGIGGRPYVSLSMDRTGTAV